jgi:hypothetical protein
LIAGDLGRLRESELNGKFQLIVNQVLGVDLEVESESSAALS